MSSQNDDELARQLKEHIQSMERSVSSQNVHQTSFTLAERAQSKAGYLIYRSSKRIERISYALVAVTIALIVLTIVLVFR